MTGVTKLLRREIIVREYDFDHQMAPAVPLLYDSAEFIPITESEIRNYALVDILKNPLKAKHEREPEHPWSWLAQKKNRCYRDDYHRFIQGIDENGYIWIQYRKNTPRSRLGWAVMTKRY
jgi:hypothetical protein